MRIMRSTNPVFRGIKGNEVFSTSNSATYGGITSKTFLLFLIAVTTGYFTASNVEFVLSNSWIMLVSMIAAFVCVMISSINPRAAKIFAPLYAAFEGMLLGTIILFISTLSTVSTAYEGIVLNAVLITLSIFLVMLLLYSTGAVRVGPMFRRVMMGALFGLILFTFSTFIIGIFSPGFREMIYGNMQLMLLVSLISAALASLFILIDLDNCTKLVQASAPKEYEWVASLGLMVTIIWLFLEILRILIIFASRRD
ncbi:Bax inhibitor-1/YccA family protein [Mycoplasmatota bacterium]|nr:Bax inhibitor-1/YccA family protein [Mycoplasmatota bacterium]